MSLALNCRSLAHALALVALLSPQASHLAAQPAPEKLFGWLDLRGNYAPTRYTPGSLDRAENFRERVELVIETLAKGGRRGFGKPITVYVLAPEEWTPAGATRQYGLPELHASTLLVPAWGTEQTVALWTGLLGSAPRGDGSMPIRGTPEEAASLVPSDLLAQVDAARAGLHATGMRASAAWVEDVLAHVVARAAFERHEPGRLPEIDAFFAHLSGLNGPAVLLDPNQFVSTISDTNARLAAEGRLFELARTLSEGKPGKLVARLIGAGEKYDGLIPAGEALKRDGAREAWARVYAR
jgi:hypothetical protein